MATFVSRQAIAFSDDHLNISYTGLASFTAKGTELIMV